MAKTASRAPALLPRAEDHHAPAIARRGKAGVAVVAEAEVGAREALLSAIVDLVAEVVMEEMVDQVEEVAGAVGAVVEAAAVVVEMAIMITMPG